MASAHAEGNHEFCTPRFCEVAKGEVIKVIAPADRPISDSYTPDPDNKWAPRKVTTPPLPKPKLPSDPAHFRDDENFFLVDHWPPEPSTQFPRADFSAYKRREHRRRIWGEMTAWKTRFRESEPVWVEIPDDVVSDEDWHNWIEQDYPAFIEQDPWHIEWDHDGKMRPDGSPWLPETIEARKIRLGKNMMAWDTEHHTGITRAEREEFVKFNHAHGDHSQCPDCDVILNQ